MELKELKSFFRKELPKDMKFKSSDGNSIYFIKGEITLRFSPFATDIFNYYYATLKESGVDIYQENYRYCRNFVNILNFLCKYLKSSVEILVNETEFTNGDNIDQFFLIKDGFQTITLRLSKMKKE